MGDDKYKYHIQRGAYCYEMSWQRSEECELHLLLLWLLGLLTVPQRCHLLISWVSWVEKVTAGLAESNGSLPPGRWIQVTCGLTACTPGSAPGPMLGNEYGRTLPFLLIKNCWCRNCYTRENAQSWNVCEVHDEQCLCCEALWKQSGSGSQYNQLSYVSSAVNEIKWYYNLQQLCVQF